MSENSSLKSKSVKGASWSFIDSMATQGITFLVGIILARLLSPGEYGLIGIITIFISIFNSIVDSGFSNALIRKTDADDKDYNTCFYTNLAFSIVLFAVLFFSAPFISSFFNEPQLIPLLRVMAIIIIINAFAIIQRTIITKRIDFKTQTKISVITAALSGIVGISMAYMGFGVWALAIQQICRQLFQTLFLWFFNRWWPSFVFSIESFRYLWGFGWKLLVSGLLNTAWMEIYQVVIGKCYTPASLGLYTRAQQFASLFSSNITGVVQRVSYPVLSSIKDDKERLKGAYKRVIRSTMLITFVCMLGLFAVSKSLVLVLLGEKWIDCVPMMRIVCFNMMLYPLHAINLNMLQVQGRSDLFLRLEIIKKIIAVGPLLLGIFVGIYWMLGSSVLVGFISYYLNAYYSGPFLNYSIKEQVKDVLPSFLIAAIMAIPVFCMSYIPLNNVLLLIIQILVGAAIVIGLCERIKLQEYIELKGIVVSFVHKQK